MNWLQSSVALTFILRSKFWATCNRIVQLDDEQNDNDRLMWQKIEWGKLANENLKGTKSTHHCFIIIMVFIIIILWLEITTAVTQAYIPYKCKKKMKKEKKTNNQRAVNGWMLLHIVACVSHNFWSHACIYVNRTEYTELSQKKNGVTAIGFAIRIHLARSQDGYFDAFLFLLFVRFPSTRSAWEMIDSVVHKWRISAPLFKLHIVLCVDLAALHWHCALAKKKVLTHSAVLLIRTWFVITLVRNVNEMWLLPSFLSLFIYFDCLTVQRLAVSTWHIRKHVPKINTQPRHLSPHRLLSFFLSLHRTACECARVRAYQPDFQ